MKKTGNITRALYEFRDALNVSLGDKDALMRVRNETRKFIRGRLGEDVRKAASGGGAPREMPKIRFLTQGSYAYQTLNRPDYVPPQQMDLDDGVYFRKSDVGAISPGMLLGSMESALGEWACRNGWKPEVKPNCCRIILPAANGGAPDKHIDCPIYKIDDARMNNLERQGGAGFSKIYEEWGIPHFELGGEVMLAHKEKGWVASDPRKVLDWVADMRSRHGMAFLNVCRYLKAWRDHQWKESPLSSIAVMAIVAHAFAESEALGGEYEDDDHLLSAAKHFAPCLQNGVFAPFDGSERLDANLSDNDKAKVQDKARGLSADMQKCLYGGITREEICFLMRSHFGDRFPGDAGGIRVIVPLVAPPQPTAATPPYAGEQ